jgi:hypothetical protein
MCTYLVDIYPTYLDLPFFTLPNSYIFEDKPYLEKGNCFEASKYPKVYVKLIIYHVCIFIYAHIIMMDLFKLWWLIIECIFI